MAGKLTDIKNASEESELLNGDDVFIDLSEYDDVVDESDDFGKPDFDNHKFSVDETEEIILSIILNNKCVPDNVNEHIFTNYTYKEVFKGIEHFSSQDKNGSFEPTAVGILISKRMKNDKWKDVIVPNLISKSFGFDYKIDNFISILKEQQVLVKGNEIAEQIKINLARGNVDYLKKAASELNDIEVFEDQGYDSIDDALDMAMFELDEKINSDSAISGIPTGIPTLDDTIGGLQKSDLIILAARPGQGKTAAAINFAYHSNASCGFISSEMPSSQLALRLLSLDSGVNAQKLRNPKKLNKKELELLGKSHLKLKNDKEIYIKDKPSISIQEVKEIAKKWKEKYDIKVLFIDYLQRLTYKAPGSERMPRSERVGMIALESKEIARELDIAVVGLAQISRGSEKNEATGGRPMLSDLKDSGMLEQEADLVLCPFRENTDGMDVNAIVDMFILILKNRHGPLGEILVKWIPKNMAIIEEDDDYQLRDEFEDDGYEMQDGFKGDEDLDENPSEFKNDEIDMHF